MDSDFLFARTAILGLGLLGGSIAIAGKKRGLLNRVAGYGRKPERLRYALDNNIADETHTTPEETVRDADLVIVCTPVGLIPEMIERIGPHLRDGAIVTDVGSTKQNIVEHAERVLPGTVSFVGGHPMAGSEESGVEAANEALFENALCILTSSAGTNIGALNKLERFWSGLKAKVLIASPEEHDLLVAASSHLAHIVAVSLTRCVEKVSEDNEKVIPLLAGGFRDTTRIASGNPEMWRDICIQNRDHIQAVIDRFTESISEISELISAGNDSALTDLFSATKLFRDDLPARGRGILEPVNELLVDVTDRPGVIGQIATSLGSGGINIRNINVQHVREIKGGTLSLILEKDSDMEPAIEILMQHGFSARKR